MMEDSSPKPKRRRRARRKVLSKRMHRDDTSSEDDSEGWNSGGDNQKKPKQLMTCAEKIAEVLSKPKAPKAKPIAEPAKPARRPRRKAVKKKNYKEYSSSGEENGVMMTCAEKIVEVLSRKNKPAETVTLGLFCKQAQATAATEQVLGETIHALCFPAHREFRYLKKTLVDTPDIQVGTSTQPPLNAEPVPSTSGMHLMKSSKSGGQKGRKNDMPFLPNYDSEFEERFADEVQEKVEKALKDMGLNDEEIEELLDDSVTSDSDTESDEERQAAKIRANPEKYELKPSDFKMSFMQKVTLQCMSLTVNGELIEFSSDDDDASVERRMKEFDELVQEIRDMPSESETESDSSEPTFTGLSIGTGGGNKALNFFVGCKKSDLPTSGLQFMREDPKRDKTARNPVPVAVTAESERFSEPAPLINNDKEKKTEGKPSTGRGPANVERKGSLMQQQKMAVNPELLQNNAGNANDERRPYVCTTCNTTFTTKSSLNRHVKCVHGVVEMLECSICGSKYRSRNSLMKHMKIHEEDSQFVCSVCNKTFSFNSALEMHARVHTGEKPYVCTSCGKAFNVKSNLTQHVQLVHEPVVQLYECHQCGKDFKLKSHLTEHIKYVHEPVVELHECHQCGKKFKRKCHLNHHIKTVHN